MAYTGAPFNFTKFFLGTMFYANPAFDCSSGTPWMLAQKSCLRYFFHLRVLVCKSACTFFASRLFNHKFPSFLSVYVPSFSADFLPSLITVQYIDDNDGSVALAVEEQCSGSGSVASLLANL